MDAEKYETGTVISENCLFCKIANGEIPSKKAYEDDEFFAFHDINPAALVHLLLIPKRHIASMQDISQKDAPWLGRLMTLVPELARTNGWRPVPQGGFGLLPTTCQRGKTLGKERGGKDE